MIGAIVFPTLTLPAISLVPFATLGYIAATAIGSILSPFAMQGYLIGGLSKSRLNYIHWDEKSARLGGCYAARERLLDCRLGVL